MSTSFPIGILLELLPWDSRSAGFACKVASTASFSNLSPRLCRPDELCSSGRQIAEPPTAFLDRDAVLLQEPVREIFKARCTCPAHAEICFRKVSFAVSNFFCCGLLSSCGAGLRFHGRVSAVRAASPNIHASLTRSFEPLSRSIWYSPALSHSSMTCDTQVPHGLGCAGVLHALTPVTGLLHIGLALHFSCPDAADHDVDMDISRMVVSVRVGADDSRMTGKVLFAEVQAEGLCLFHRQAHFRLHPAGRS